ncbi:MAG: hypothetical protein R6X25_16510 [Candidatus Krumholzibacteriia bacterium]
MIERLPGDVETPAAALRAEHRNEPCVCSCTEERETDEEDVPDRETMTMQIARDYDING